MIRFLLFLFGKKYDSVEVEILKQQLAIANEEKKELTTTLLKIIKPEIIRQPPQQELKDIRPIGTTWARRRAILEQRDRLEAQVKANSPFISKDGNKDTNEQRAMINTIDNLEQELGIQEEVEDQNPKGAEKNG